MAAWLASNVMEQGFHRMSLDPWSLVTVPGFRMGHENRMKREI